jgi:tetratricopeptide (TPR) repeat protein
MNKADRGCAELRLAGAAFLAWLALPAAGSGAPPPWIEVKSAHFTAISDAGHKEARRTLWQFEQIRAALTSVWPWAKVDGGSPLIVFAVRNETTLKSLGPEYWEGKHFRPVSFGATGRDRRFIVLRTDLHETDDPNDNPYRYAFWSYVSAVLARSFPRPLPPWYHRGVSEVWSNTIVREKELQIGRALDHNVRRARQGLMRWDDFFAAERGSPLLTRESAVEQFDAQAWAFVHYLMFGDDRAHVARLNRLSQLLMKGAAPDAALREAFGELSPYLDNVHLYVSQRLLPYVRVPVALELDVETFGLRTLGAAEAALARAELHVAKNRPNEARALAAEAAAADPRSPGQLEVEAQLLDRDDQSQKAREAYARAAELGSQRAFVHYRLAQLDWKPEWNETAVKRQEALLRRAHELDPGDANVMSFLADTLAVLGGPAEALPLARKAVETDPSSSYHRITLARIVRDLGRVDDALPIAVSALAAADGDEERRRASAFLDELRRLQVAPAPTATAQTSVVAGERKVATEGEAPPVAPDALAGGARVLHAETSDIGPCFSLKDDAACAKAAPQLDVTCQAGQAVSCRSLGSLYDGGWGVELDKARAATAYDQGCRGGDDSSCARLAVLQVTGQGTAPEPVLGVSTLQRLCGRQVDDACIGWALVLMSQRDGSGIAKARSLLESSCGRESEEACRLLSTMSAARAPEPRR